MQKQRNSIPVNDGNSSLSPQGLFRHDTGEDVAMSFNRDFFVHLGILLKPYWVSCEKKRALLFLCLNVFCIFLEVRAAVFLTLFNKDFYNAIQAYQTFAILQALTHFSLIILVLFCTYCLGYYLNSWIAIHWRRWLTQFFLRQWLSSSHTHYMLQKDTPALDNPDQRLSEDIDVFTDLSLKIVFSVFKNILIIISFGLVLWQLSLPVLLQLGPLHVEIHGVFFWAALVYAATVTAANFYMGRRLSYRQALKQKYNANFRYSLVRIRDNSEGIALCQGEQQEYQVLNSQFSSIVKNFFHIVAINIKLTFCVQLYNNVAGIAGSLVALPLYLAKKMTLGGMMQMSSAFGWVLFNASTSVSAFDNLTQWRATAERLIQLQKSFLDTPSQDQALAHHNDTTSTCICVDQLVLYKPNGVPLFLPLNFCIQPADHVAIIGPSGAGKSTLIKALAGVWPYGQGSIRLPARARMMFLPQRPYMPEGCLRDAVLYPSHMSGVLPVVTPDFIEHVLVLFGLKHFFEKWESRENWSEVLSFGEQQRVALARIVFHKPDFVFLDEATSAVDHATAQTIYDFLYTQLPRTAFVHSGHDLSVGMGQILKVIQLRAQSDLCV